MTPGGFGGQERRLKVIHLITLLELGGAQGHAIHTVRHLDPERFDARLWCGRGGYWDLDVEGDLGAAGRLRFFRNLVRPVRPLSDLLIVYDLWKAFREERPDVLQTHSSKAGIVGRVAAWLAGVPVVIHMFHGFGFNDRQNFLVRALYVRLERWTARLATKLIFVSEANRRTAEETEIGRPSQYAVIRAGVSLSDLERHRVNIDRSGVRRDLGLPNDSRLVTTLSAFKPQKNLSDFIEVARRVCAKVPQAVFVLLGDGEERPDIERRVRELNLGDRIRMPGWRRDSARILAASDVFVLTSLWEGLPRALVEAMALRVPSVCYETDGVSDLLGREKGEMLARGDLEGMTTSVIRLLGDSSHAAALAESQNGRLSRDFDIDEVVLQQADLYLSLLPRAIPAVDNPHRNQ